MLFLSFEAMEVKQAEKQNRNPWIMRVLGMGKTYFVKTPWWLRKIYPTYIWRIKTDKKILYLSFDDGPHPQATPFILGELKKYHAKATFFCVGKNVVAYPGIYKRILQEGHSVGNHTYNHLNGWQTPNEIYLQNVAEAAKHIESDLFRPCYGRITNYQAKNLNTAIEKQAKVIMWDVLSGDFDMSIKSEKVLQNVITRSGPGSIIVFHDNEKTFATIQYVLPKVLDYFSQKGYLFEKL